MEKAIGECYNAASYPMTTTLSTALAFSPGFLWGTATAAHQVEGNNDRNDWWRWEHLPGRIKDGSVSGLACDHFRRFRDDFRLLADLHQNAHRLSLEWSRIESHPGVFDREAVAHYRAVLEHLRSLGIEPVVTLHHFTNPLWLVEAGGWERPEVVDAFERFVREAIKAYGDLVRYWVTINEPVVYAYMGYAAGAWPPGVRSLRRSLAVLRNLVRAHGRAYRLIHDLGSATRPLVGIAHNMRLFDPAGLARPLASLIASVQDYLFNRSVLLTLADGRLRFPFGRGERLSEVAGSMDFVGLNYYTRDCVAVDLRRPRQLCRHTFPAPGAPVSLYGWEVYPEGIYRCLREIARFGKPILVTENGVADEADELRPGYLVQHLAEIHRAVAANVPVMGYFHWSAFDNFEWAEGLRMRFGLVHVDFSSQERTVKPSGLLYRDICRHGGLTDAALRLGALPVACRP